jgi:hypothetical protein
MKRGIPLKVATLGVHLEQCVTGVTVVLGTKAVNETLFRARECAYRNALEHMVVGA